jgi:hypothetical protein
LPVIRKRRLEWIDKIHRCKKKKEGDRREFAAHVVVCSRHFTDGDYKNRLTRKRLNNEALPTIFECGEHGNPQQADPSSMVICYNDEPLDSGNTEHSATSTSSIRSRSVHTGGRPVALSGKGSESGPPRHRSSASCTAAGQGALLVPRTGRKVYKYAIALKRWAIRMRYYGAAPYKFLRNYIQLPAIKHSQAMDWCTKSFSRAYN